MPSINASQGQKLIAQFGGYQKTNTVKNSCPIYQQRPAHVSGVTMPSMASAQYREISSIISHTDPRSAHGTVD